MRIGFRSRRRGMLDKILTAKRALTGRMRASPVPVTGCLPRPAPLESAFRPQDGAVGWVAEIRFRILSTPSTFPFRKAELGAARTPEELSRVLDPAARSLVYARQGCRFISVCTDADFLGGKLADLAWCRRALDAAYGARRPTLFADDFIVDPIQLTCLAAAGADGVVLRARLAETDGLDRLLREAGERGLAAWVEVDDEASFLAARDAGATALLVSPVDLDTLRRDEDRATELVHRAREGAGRRLIGRRTELVGGSPPTLEGVDLGWTGTELMRQDDPQAWLASLLRER